MNKWQTEGNCGQWILAMQGSFSLSVIVKPWGSAHSNSVSIKNPKVFRHSTQRTPEIFHRKRFLTKNNVSCFRFVIPCSSPGKKRSPKPISTSYWFNLKRISYINIFDFDIFEWMNEWTSHISFHDERWWDEIPFPNCLYFINMHELSIRIWILRIVCCFRSAWNSVGDASYREFCSAVS